MNKWNSCLLYPLPITILGKGLGKMDGLREQVELVELQSSDVSESHA